MWLELHALQMLAGFPADGWKEVRDVSLTKVSAAIAISAEFSTSKSFTETSGHQRSGERYRSSLEPLNALVAGRCLNPGVDFAVAVPRSNWTREGSCIMQLVVYLLGKQICWMFCEVSLTMGGGGGDRTKHTLDNYQVAFFPDQAKTTIYTILFSGRFTYIFVHLSLIHKYTNSIDKWSINWENCWRTSRFYVRIAVEPLERKPTGRPVHSICFNSSQYSYEW